MAYTKYSLTPANNNATPPDGAPEGMLPSAVNDTMRDMMAQIRDVGDGIRNGTYTMTAPVITGGSITGSTINNSAIGGTTANSGAFTTLSASGATTFSGATVVSGSLTANTFSSSGATITGGSINGTAIGGSTAASGTFTSLSDSGNLTFTGTGNRITGDFSNGTFSNRVAFQTSTTNGNTLVAAIPNGTSTTAGLWVYNNSDLTNAGRFRFSIGSGEASIISDYNGSGTYLPLIMLTGGSERLRIDTSGNVGINTTPVANTTSKLFVGGDFTLVGASGAYAFNVYYDSVQARWEYAGTGTGAAWIDSGSGNYTFQSTGSTSGNAGDAASALTERMRITSGGILCVNGTAQLGSGIASFTGSASVGVIDLRNSSATSGRYWRVGPDTGNSFLVYNEANAGVYLLYGGTSWTSSSDERLKDIIEPISNAAAKVSSLRAVIGKFKTDEQDTRRAFLIAQDVEKVLPEAVNTDAKGNLGLQYTDTIPLLVAAIKEQQTMIEELKQEVALLKAK